MARSYSKPNSSLDLVPVIGDLITRCHFPPPGTLVTCAVSGGADSMTLLVLASAAGCEVTAVHVDHGLRPNSASEAEVVAAAAERFGATFRAETIEVAPGPNLEARARRERYRVLPDDVLTGHTADDQAETMLLNLMRGAAIEGLAGIRAERRPILGLRRHETVELCRVLAVETVDDPTNRDPIHLRNRVRHELIPLMNELADRDVVPVLARQAPLFREVAEYLETTSEDIDPTDAAALAEAPPVLARQTIRRWLRLEGGFTHPPSQAAVERILRVARGEIRATDVSNRWRVARTAGRLRLERD